MKRILISVIFCGMIASLQAKTDSLSQSSLDFQTPESVATKLLDFISFEKGEVKDWDEYRNLFLPNAQELIYSPKPGKPLFQQAMAWNVEEVIKYGGPTYSKEGFEEYAIGLEVNEFNGIATVFQSFECRTLDGTYEARGVNTYLMVYLENRWWISSATYTNESEDVRIPNELLFEKYRNEK